ncbi:hypothetical protein [Paenibacillus sp.]|uniref:hypothetical protein n=1 Tax=Paenibacillus sp. TaxID=58172 RepID=UPI002811BC22|nr:hypothetical protein [Paenibacillus sp.]
MENGMVRMRQQFTDHGVPAPAVESRTAAVCRNLDGDERVVVLARGFLLVVDPATERCAQVPFPNGNEEYPYICFAGSDGTFYTGAGTQFLAFDPFEGMFLHAEDVGAAGELVGFSFAESADGTIYFAAYPHCRLFAYHPSERRVAKFGSLDKTEKYPSHLAADAEGWVYAGIGTERKGIVAYRPADGLAVQLVPEDERTRGMGVVHASADGAVFGHWAFSDLREEETPERYRWMRFQGGRAVPVDWRDVPPSLYSGAAFFRLHRQLSGAWRVEKHDLAERELTLRAADGAGVRTIPLRYECGGAQLSPLAAGPDGRVYGTSNHPLHFFRYDPAEERLRSFGGKAIQFGGGGNLCAYASVGPVLAGAAYPGGHLHLFDTRLPVSEEGEPRNPRIAVSHKEVHRPRCMLAHSDGEHVLYGGYPGYGAVGGGLCVYNVATGVDTLLTHERIVPYQSTICLAEGKGGAVFGGTSVETPGGAEPRETRAKLYRLRWDGLTVDRVWSPVEAREIVWVYADRLGRIHGMTSGSSYFVFDPDAETVVAETDLSAWGTPVRVGLTALEDGLVYGALSRALFRLDPDSDAPVKLAEPPVPATSGLAVAGGRLFFGAGSHLWSFALERDGEVSEEGSREI